MFFSKRLGFRPGTQPFVAGPDWKKFTLPFASFGDVDGSDLMGIVWAAGPKTGTFFIDLDNIRIE